MKKKALLLFTAAMLAVATTVSAGPFPVPPIPKPPKPPAPPKIDLPAPPAPPMPPAAAFPPPPPTIVIKKGEPRHWFWDDNEAIWFYYDVDHEVHYVRHHVYVDDGRHYYLHKGKWKVGGKDVGRHKGWFKHKKKKK